MLGLPTDQAEVTIASVTRSESGAVPDGEITVPIQTCRACVDASGVDFPLGTPPDMPTITLPGDN